MNLLLTMTLILNGFPAPFLQSVSAQTKKQDVNQVIVTYKSDKEAVKTMKVPSDQSPTEFIKQLQDQPKIASVERDYVMKRSEISNDPYFDTQWYHQVIHTPKAWAVTTGSNSEIVAVIDDGIDLNQKDLKNQIIAPYDVIHNSTLTIPVGEHGTHVSGIIAGSLNNAFDGVGVAPNVKIMPINVFDGEDALYSDVIKGIDYAINHGANIINLSLGGNEPSAILNDAIQRAYQAGILIIAAAGNDGQNIEDYPASYDHVVGVSATNHLDYLAYFSNYGPQIDLAAPGTDIYSTLPNNKFGEMSGTSMATPIVSGTAALVWSVNNHLTNAQVAEQLYKTADDLGPVGKDIYYGYGRINAYKAVATASNINLSTPVKEWSFSVNDISDSDTFVKGTISKVVQDSTITIYTNQKVLATAKIQNQDYFTLQIPKQKAGTKVYIKLENSAVNPVMKIVADKTAPAKPFVNIVTSKTKNVTGKAEANSTVYIKSGNTIIGFAKVNPRGNYVIRINKQRKGNILSIYAMDQSKNRSKAAILKVM